MNKKVTFPFSSENGEIFWRMVDAFWNETMDQMQYDFDNYGSIFDKMRLGSLSFKIYLAFLAFFKASKLITIHF